MKKVYLNLVLTNKSLGSLYTVRLSTFLILAKNLRILQIFELY